MLDGSERIALFFADYSLGLVGLRDGPWKFVHELESTRDKLFNLERDPLERTDVAGDHQERVGWYRRNLLEWSGAQKGRLAVIEPALSPRTEIPRESESTHTR